MLIKAGAEFNRCISGQPLTSVYEEKGDVKAERKAQKAFSHAYQSRLALQVCSIPGHATYKCRSTVWLIFS